MTRLLTLTEHVSSEPVILSTDERDELRRLIPGLVVEPVPGAADTYTLTTGSAVGVVRVGALTVEVRPKVGIAPLVSLLTYAADPRRWREEQAHPAVETNLVEAVVPMFARMAHAAVGPGLLHGYRHRDDTLVTIRGRIRMADQFRARTGLPTPVEVTYDDFTPDILENQLLKTAVDVLARLHLRDPGTRRSLVQLHQQLDGVRSLPPTPGDVPEPLWTQHNERYRPAVSLARRIIPDVGLEAGEGGHGASAMLTNMNDVFERFVRTALRERLGLSARAFPAACAGRPIFLDTAEGIGLQPNLSWWVEGRCVFAGDCRYRRPVGDVPNADLYQLLAYLTVLDLSDGLLVYAAAEDTPRSVTVRRAGKRLHVRTLDITRPRQEILVHISTLASEIRAMALSHIRQATALAS